MASCQRIETGSDAERDLISELPVYLKERILESLPTRDAARTAFLSTHWKDVWLRHGRLAFDWDFVRWLQECQELAKAAPTFPTARNLQVIKLCRFRFGCEEHLKLAKQLIEKSPNLCRLEIAETQDSFFAELQEDWNDDKEGPSKIFEGPDIIQELCIRHNAVALKTSSELLGFLSPEAQIGFLN
nr:F-box/FBD/LRR-repeat protein At1g13570-like [Ipomoea batatas]